MDAAVIIMEPDRIHCGHSDKSRLQPRLQLYFIGAALVF